MQSHIGPSAGEKGDEVAKTRVRAPLKRVSHKKKTKRSKRDRASTEHKLIVTATAVFSKYGYDASTTKMISTKSGVNESLIMRYFGGKEGLLLEIVRRFFEERKTIPLPYPPQDSLNKEIFEYLRYSYQVSRKHDEVFRIMLLRASFNPTVKKKVLELMPMAGDLKLLERIDRLKKLGKIPASLDPHMMSLIGFQFFSATFISSLLFEEKMQKEIEAKLEDLAQFTLSGLLKS